jgi:uncharacterized protein CbrC (UPF0167 family)
MIDVGASMSADKPFFRFHPGAYERGVFVESDDQCDVCSRPGVWLYDGIVYTTGEAPLVCARCIADGKLATFIGEDFSLHDTDLEEEVDETVADEVMMRTPGFSSFNAFTWPVRGGQPLTYFGHGEEPHVWADPAAVEAVKAAFEAETGETVDGPTPHALVFRDLAGTGYVAVVDLD